MDRTRRTYRLTASPIWRLASTCCLVFVAGAIFACLWVSPASAQPPQITQVLPSELPQGSSTLIQALGANFQPGDEVSFFPPGIIVEFTEVLGPGQLRAFVAIQMSTAPGSYDVIVRNLEGQSDTLLAGFTVVPAEEPPIIKSISPNSGLPGQTVAVTISGANFQNGGELILSNPAITYQTVQVQSSTSITAQFIISSSAIPGFSDVGYQNPSGMSGTLANAFEILSPPPPPTISSIVPDSIIAGATGTVLTVNGSDFPVELEAFINCGGVTITNVSRLSANQIQITVDASPSATPATCGISIFTENGTAACGSCLRVVGQSPQPPTINAVTPSTVVQGSTGNVLTIQGSNFVITALVSFGCPGISVITQQLLSPGELRVTVNVSPTTPTGSCNVNVTTTAGSATCNGCLTVNAPPPLPPTVTGVNPNQITRGADNVELTIAGAEFRPEASVSFTCSGMSLVSTEFVSATEIRVVVDVASSGSIGPCDVRVVTGGGTGVCEDCLIILAPQPPVPTVASVAPDTLIQGANGVTLVLIGTGFTEQAQVLTTCNGVSLSGFQYVNSSQVRITATIAADAALGSCNVSVTTAGGTGTCAGCIAVVPESIQPPTISGIVPDSGIQGTANTAITISGTGFQTPLTITSPCAGVTFHTINFISDISITAQIDVAAGATSGPCDVIVTTDAGDATCEGCFRVIASPKPPLITAVAPSTIMVGQGEVVIAISGTNFTPTSSIEISCGGVVVVSTGFVSDSALETVINVTDDAVPGACDVTVTTPAGSATCPGCVTITPEPLAPPSITSASPMTLTQGEENILVTITGAGFLPGTTVSFNCGGVTASSIQVNSETQITAEIDVGLGAVPGPCGVTVANDAGADTCATCITIVERAPPPVVTSITPSQIPRGGAPRTVTIVGENFTAPIQISTSCSGVAFHSAEITGPSQITAVIEAQSGAGVGPCNVSVVTNAGSGTCPSCLTVIDTTEVGGGYDYAKRRAITVLPISPGSDFGADVSITETRPLFTWDFTTDGIEQGTVRFRLLVFAVQPGQTTTSDVLSNWPVMVVPEIAGDAIEYPPYIDPLQPGQSYLWFLQAYDAADPATSVIGRSEYFGFSLTDDATTRPSVIDEPRVDTEGRIQLISPGGPCPEGITENGFSSWGYGSVFELSLDPSIVSIEIITWFVPCGRELVPVPDRTTTSRARETVVPSGQGGNAVIRETVSGRNIVDFTWPSIAPPLLCGGAYAWTASGTTADGETMTADGELCFRNGDCNVMVWDPPPLTGADGETPETPGTAQTGPGTTTTRPPGATTSGPREEYPVPGTEQPPPEIDCQECVVTVYPEDCDWFRIDPIPPRDPDFFPYPRAVPLLVVGDDADRIVTECHNCDHSVKKEAVKDDIASYDWVLEGKGSLNVPFDDPYEDEKIIDSLQNILDSLKARLKAVEARLEALKTIIEGLVADSADLARQHDSLSALSDDMAQRAVQTRGAYDDMRDQVNSTQEWIDAARERAQALSDSLDGAPGDEELALYEQLSRLRTEFDALKDELDSFIAETQAAVASQSQMIAQLQSDVDAARAQLDALTLQLQGLQNQISSLIGQLYDSRPELSAFRIAYTNFNYRFCREGAGENNRLLSDFMDVMHRFVRARSASRRDSLAAVAIPRLESTMPPVRVCCQSGDNYCRAELSALEHKFDTLRTLMDVWRSQGTPPDAGITRQLDSLSGVLVTAQGGIDALTGQITAKEEALGDALAEFVHAAELADAEEERQRSAIDAKGQEINQTQAALDEAIARRREELERRRDEWEEELALLNDSIQVKLDTLDSQQDSLAVLSDSLDAAVSDSSRVATERDKIEERLANVSAHLAEVRAEQQDLENEKKDLEARIKELEDEIEKLKVKLAELRKKGGNKTWSGQTVYYIPPPIDYIIAEDEDKQEKFDSLRADVKRKEAAHEAAFQSLRGWQKAKYKYFESYAKDAYRGKALLDEIAELNDEKSDLNEELSTKKVELKQERLEDYAKATAAIDSALGQIEALRSELEDKKAQNESSLEEVELRIQALEDSLTALESKAEELRAAIADRVAEAQFHSEQLTRAEETMEQRRGELREAQSRVTAIEQELRAIRSRISSAIAADDEQLQSQGQTELNEATSRRNLAQEQVDRAQADLQSVSQTIAAQRTALATIQTARDSLGIELGRTERAIHSANTELDDLKRTKADLEEVKEKLEEYEKSLDDQEQELTEEKAELQAKTDDEINEDIDDSEDVKSLKERLEDIEDAIKANNEEVQRINAALAENVAVGPHIRDSLKSKEEKAKDELEAAEKALREFLLQCVDELAFTDTIHITIDDANLIYPDDPREDREAFLITYTGRKVKVTPKPIDGAHCQDEEAIGEPICIPIVGWDKSTSITLIKSTGPTEEIRTNMLLYEDGRILWPEWHQSEHGAIYRHEVVPFERLFGDVDLQLNECRSQICIPASLKRSWSDVVYTTFGGAEFTNTEFAEKVFLKVPPIPKDPPLCDKDEELQVVGKDSGAMAADDPLKVKIIYGHKQSMFVEKLDSLMASPEDTLKLKIRLTDTEGKGTPDEDVAIVIKEARPKDQTGHGINKKDRLADTLTTDGSGFIEFDFICGKKFGDYKVEVDWIRNKKKPKSCEKYEFRVDVPLFHELVKFAFGPDPLTDDLKAAWESGVSDLASIPVEVDTATGNRILAAVTCLHDYEADSVNGIEVTFAGQSTEGPVTFDPKLKASEWWGISRSVIEDHPDTLQVHATATVKDTSLHPFTRKPKVDMEYSGRTANRFKIGVGGDLFTVETDESFVPGERIDGGGKFIFEFSNPLLSALVEQLGEIHLDVEGVQTNEDDTPLAVSGAVKWSGDTLGFSVGNRFSFGITAVGVEAGLGGRLDGLARFKATDTAEDRTIVLKAYVGAEGDFIADIESMPELDFGLVKVKEGGSAVIDMSRKPSQISAPVAEGPVWMGLYIRELNVALPFLMKSDPPGAEPPGVFAKAFYVGTVGGINGEVGGTNLLKDVGLLGYSFTLDTLAVKLENGNLRECKVAGQVQLKDPVHGRLGMSLTVTDALAVTGRVYTVGALAIPSWGMTIDLIDGCSFAYDDIAEVTLNFNAKSAYFNQLLVRDFKINSNYEISLKKIAYQGTPQKFMEAFEYHIQNLELSKNDDDLYQLNVAGEISFPDLISIAAGVTIVEGPTVSVDSVRIQYEKGPVELEVALSYSESEFKGEADIKIKPGIDIEGMFVIGAADRGDGESYDYWYGELAVGTRILLGQTGLALFKLGGGVGVHYRPPIGNDPGGPDYAAALGLKALVEIGTADGTAMRGRLTMVFANPRFSLNGKVWVMDMEENCFGEGQINIVWDPVNKIDGYVLSEIRLPTADGELLDFRGDVGYCFGSCNGPTFLIKSRELTGKALFVVSAEGEIDINNSYCYLRGSLKYGIDKEVSALGTGFHVNVGLGAEGELLICYIDDVTLTSHLEFSGWADVDLLVLGGTVDILSANINTNLGLSYNNDVCITGQLHVDYSVLFASGSADLSLSYPDECTLFEGCR